MSNEQHNKKMRDYLLTIRGKAARMWNGMQSRAENKAGIYPTYQNVKLLLSRKKFISWVIPELENWQKIHGSLKEVSLDRINNDGHYEDGNLQLLTKVENSLKRDRNKNLVAPEGKAWCGGCKAYLPKDEFRKNAKQENGVQWNCKKCASDYTNNWRMNNPEKDRAQRDKYNEKRREQRRKRI